MRVGTLIALKRLPLASATKKPKGMDNIIVRKNIPSVVVVAFNIFDINKSIGTLSNFIVSSGVFH